MTVALRAEPPEPAPAPIDPVDQLIHAIRHARQALDRVDEAIEYAATRQPTNTNGDSPNRDPLFVFTTPLGQHMQEVQHKTRLSLALFAKQYIQLGIEERQVQALEGWANLFAPIITAIMQDAQINLTPQQRKQLPQVVEKHIVELEGMAQTNPSTSAAPGS